MVPEKRLPSLFGDMNFMVVDFAGGEGSGEAIAGRGSWEAFFLKISVEKEKRPSAVAEGRLEQERSLAEAGGYFS
jgi:hypothetical protein